MPRVVSSSPTWESFKRERQGRRVCVICDSPLRGKQRALCGDPECWRACDAIQRADRRRRESREVAS